MRDMRRRGSEGNIVDQAIDQAIQTITQDLPRDEQIALMRRLRVSLGELLTTAPATNSNPIEDLANRARLAAAFNVKLPGDER
jgi:hypothetical protein